MLRNYYEFVIASRFRRFSLGINYSEAALTRPESRRRTPESHLPQKARASNKRRKTFRSSRRPIQPPPPLHSTVSLPTPYPSRSLAPPPHPIAETPTDSPPPPPLLLRDLVSSPSEASRRREEHHVRAGLSSSTILSRPAGLSPPSLSRIFRLWRRGCFRSAASSFLVLAGWALLAFGRFSHLAALRLLLE